MDIRPCIDYITNSCQLFTTCERANESANGKVTNGELVTPDLWNGECNCYYPSQTLADFRQELSELRREHLQDTLP